MTNAITAITPAPATPVIPATSKPKSVRRKTRGFTAQQVCDFLNGRPVSKAPPASYPHIPAIGPDGWPPRRFEEGRQPRGTVTGAEAAACLGICPGRLRAEAKSWGLVPFAYGPRGEVVYWAKHVEAIRDSRTAKKAARRVEPEKLAA